MLVGRREGERERQLRHCSGRREGRGKGLLAKIGMAGGRGGVGDGCVARQLEDLGVG